MREIKFRIWDGEIMGESTYMKLPSQTEYEGTDIKVMQYTGLCDINRREIYEGDVVYQEFNDARSLDDGGFTGYIVFDEGAWWITNGLNHAIPLWSEVNWNEVIGNIYENPNLLEAAK